jgi:hypothetical protein
VLADFAKFDLVPNSDEHVCGESSVSSNMFATRVRFCGVGACAGGLGLFYTAKRWFIIMVKLCLSIKQTKKRHPLLGAPFV